MCNLEHAGFQCPRDIKPFDEMTVRWSVTITVSQSERKHGTYQSHAISSSMAPMRSVREWPEPRRKLTICSNTYDCYENSKTSAAVSFLRCQLAAAREAKTVTRPSEVKLRSKLCIRT